MSSPVTAPSGIYVAGLGMLVAVLASFLYVFSVDAAAKPLLPINIGLAILGGGLAWWSGKKVAMTAMPQMVALQRYGWRRCRCHRGGGTIRVADEIRAKWDTL